MPVTSPRLLKSTAILMLLFAGGHMLGAASSWSPLGETDTLAAMRAFEFDVTGGRRTYWDFYYGFGVYIGVLLVLQGVLVWQLGSLAAAGVAALRPVLLAMVIGWTAGTAVLWVYIFAIPALFSTACTAGLAAALIRTGPPR